MNRQNLSNQAEPPLPELHLRLLGSDVTPSVLRFHSDYS